MVLELNIVISRREGWPLTVGIVDGVGLGFLLLRPPPIEVSSMALRVIIRPRVFLPVHLLFQLTILLIQAVIDVDDTI